MSADSTIIEGIVKRETDLAVLIAVDGDYRNEHWIPKSQISWESTGGLYEIGETIELEIPEWMAEKNGLK